VGQSAFAAQQDCVGLGSLHTISPKCHGAPPPSLRYDNLEFQLTPGNTGEGLQSLLHLGYRLADKQQLPGTLQGFCQYLILVATSTARSTDQTPTRVLIPSGRILEDASSTSSVLCRVAVNPDPSLSSIPISVFNVHPRLQSLQATSVADRLQLASLYAATGTLLPEGEGGRGMTGHEVAVRLVRESWVNRPLTPQESKHLDEVMK
jgi:hypothetical protein